MSNRLEPGLLLPPGPFFLFFLSMPMSMAAAEGSSVWDHDFRAYCGNEIYIMVMTIGVIHKLVPWFPFTRCCETGVIYIRVYHHHHHHHHHSQTTDCRSFKEVKKSRVDKKSLHDTKCFLTGSLHYSCKEEEKDPVSDDALTCQE